LTLLCRYRKGFELQSTLYSGINLAVLLLAEGQQFESSMELRKIGKHPLMEPQTCFLPLSCEGNKMFIEVGYEDRNMVQAF